MRLVLASSSPYRRALLQRLGLPFEVDVPDLDEAPLPGEAPRDLAARLATEKANRVAARDPQATLIGSDQVADVDGIALGKAGNETRARAQLLHLSGRTVSFWTAVTVLHQGRMLGTHIDHTRCRVRALTADEITRYLAREPAFDCAGSFKVEGLGISLFDAVECTDPTALQGLPLIALAELLRRAGYACP